MWLNLHNRRKKRKLLCEADMQSVRRVPGIGRGLTFLDIFKLCSDDDGGGGDVGYFIVAQGVTRRRRTPSFVVMFVEGCSTEE